MMRKFILLAALSVLISSMFIAVASANDSLQVSADISGDVVSLDVPTTLYLGGVARGFDTNDTNKITITNNGNTKISITPELASGADPLFSNIYLKRIQSDSYKRIGQFSMNISRPSTLGGSSSETCYIKLDLTSYGGSLDSGTTRKNANLRFVAVAV